MQGNPYWVIVFLFSALGAGWLLAALSSKHKFTLPPTTAAHWDRMLLDYETVQRKGGPGSNGANFSMQLLDSYCEVLYARSEQAGRLCETLKVRKIGNKYVTLNFRGGFLVAQANERERQAAQMFLARVHDILESTPASAG